MEEFNGFENVMNEIDIIKGIKELEEANKKLEENGTNEKREYENSAEGELLQELDEIRDVEARKKLIEKIKDLRQPKLDDLYVKLNDKIKQKENIVSQMKKIIAADKGKITKLKKACEELETNKEDADWEKQYNENMSKIEELSQSIEKLSKELEIVSERLNDLKNKNFDKILEEAKKQEKEQPEGEDKKATEQESTQNREPSEQKQNQEKTELNNDNELKWHNKLTREQIEELQAEGIEPGDPEYYLALANYGIKDNAQKQVSQDNVRTTPIVEGNKSKGNTNGASENKGQEGNTNGTSENKGQEENTNGASGNKGQEESTNGTSENKGQEGNTNGTSENKGQEENTNGASENEESTNGISENNVGENVNDLQNDNKEKVDSIIINEDKIEISTAKNKIELFISEQTEEEKQLYANLSEETRDRIDKLLNDDSVKLDIPVVFGLYANEKQLNDYLDLCELYKYIDMDTEEAKAAFEQFKTTQELPQITYNLKGIRKSELDLATKLDRYSSAKEMKKIFEKMGLKDKVDIKIGLMDKMYLGVKGFIKNIKNKKSLPASQKLDSIEAVQDEYVTGETVDLSQEETKLDEYYESEPIQKDETYEPELIKIPDEFFESAESSDSHQQEDKLTDEELSEIMELLKNNKKKSSFRDGLAGHNIDHEKAIENAEQKDGDSVQEKEPEQ